MRSLAAVAMLCVMAGAAMGDPVEYVFDVTSATAIVDILPDGVVDPDPFTVLADGTFSMILYQSDNHVGQSDTFVLGAANVTNTEEIVVAISTVATATLSAGSARLLDFDMSEPAHIGPGGAATVVADIDVEATAYISGVISSTIATRLITPDAEFDMLLSTSVTGSDVLTATIDGAFSYEYAIAEISQTLTLDIVVNVVGTAHVVPDPSLGGLTALGIAGAGVWLRRRRANGAMS